jgi:hypothetical protein
MQSIARCFLRRASTRAIVEEQPISRYLRNDAYNSFTPEQLLNENSEQVVALRQRNEYYADQIVDPLSPSATPSSLLEQEFQHFFTAQQFQESLAQVKEETTSEENNTKASSLRAAMELNEFGMPPRSRTPVIANLSMEERIELTQSVFSLKTANSKAIKHFNIAKIKSMFERKEADTGSPEVQSKFYFD